MNLTKSPKRYLRPMVRLAETPRRFTRNSVGHLRAAFFNFLKITCYEPFRRLQSRREFAERTF